MITIKELEQEPTTNGEKMDFPETFEEFAEYYGFKDEDEVYTNGSDLIQVYRVKQWLEHANRWIPTNERQPKENGSYLACYRADDGAGSIEYRMVDHCNAGGGWLHESKKKKVIAWMPLPDPYKAETRD